VRHSDAVLPFVDPDPAHEEIDFAREAERRSGQDLTLSNDPLTFGWTNVSPWILKRDEFRFSHAGATFGVVAALILF